MWCRKVSGLFKGGKWRCGKYTSVESRSVERWVVRSKMRGGKGEAMKDSNAPAEGGERCDWGGGKGAIFFHLSLINGLLDDVQVAKL